MNELERIKKFSHKNVIKLYDYKLNGKYPSSKQEKVKFWNCLSHVFCMILLYIFIFIIIG